MNDELEKHFRAIGWTVERVQGGDQKSYLVIRDYAIQAGRFAGRMCDVAFERTTAVPYIPPAAIHTRPALVPMDMNRYRTQASPLGPEWQYWSRLLRGQPTPRAMVAHIATILSEV